MNFNDIQIVTFMRKASKKATIIRMIPTKTIDTLTYSGLYHHTCVVHSINYSAPTMQHILYWYTPPTIIYHICAQKRSSTHHNIKHNMRDKLMAL